jgi:hypothetical protein
MIAENTVRGALPWGSTCTCVPWARLMYLDHEDGRHVCCLSCGVQWVEWKPDPELTRQSSS